MEYFFLFIKQKAKKKVGFSLKTFMFSLNLMCFENLMNEQHFLYGVSPNIL